MRQCVKPRYTSEPINRGRVGKWERQGPGWAQSLERRRRGVYMCRAWVSGWGLACRWRARKPAR
eukprot:3607528-Prymnesium_polylepis.2